MIRMFKKCLCLLLCTLFLCPSASAAEGQFSKNLLFSRHHSPSSAVLIGDALYLIDDTKLFRYASPASSAELLTDLAKLPDFESIHPSLYLLCTDGRSLFFFHKQNGDFYRFAENTLEKITTLDIASLQEKDPDRPHFFSHPVLYENAVYLSYGAYFHSLYRFSLEDGKGERIDFPNIDLYEFHLLPNGELYILDDNSTLYQVDLKRKEILSTVTALEPQSFALACNTSDKTWYYLNLQHLFLWKNGSKELMGYVHPAELNETAFSGIWQGHYVVLNDQGLQVYAPEAPPESKSPSSLTIWRNTFPNDPDLQNAISKYVAKFPATSFHFVGKFGDDPVNAVLEANLSNDQNLDIFILDSDQVDPQMLIRRGYAFPIASEKLYQDIKSMYPQIQDAILFDNKAFAYPYELYHNYWIYNPELLPQIEINSPPKTFEEYGSALLQWWQKHHTVTPACNFWTSHPYYDSNHLLENAFKTYICANYSNDTPPSFDNPLLRSLLEKCRSLCQYDLSEEEAEKRSLLPSVFSVDLDLDLRNPKTAFMQPPSFDENSLPMTFSKLMYFVINPKSRNVQEALQFLEFYSENLYKEFNYAIHPENNQPTEWENYPVELAYLNEEKRGHLNTIKVNEEHLSRAENEITKNIFRKSIDETKQRLALLELEFTELENRRWEISEKQILEYREFAKYMYIGHSAYANELYPLLENSIHSYLNNEITLDACIEQMNKDVLMFFYESH